MLSTNSWYVIFTFAILCNTGHAELFVYSDGTAQRLTPAPLTPEQCDAACDRANIGGQALIDRVNQRLALYKRLSEEAGCDESSNKSSERCYYLNRRELDSHAMAWIERVRVDAVTYENCVKELKKATPDVVKACERAAPPAASS